MKQEAHWLKTMGSSLILRNNIKAKLVFAFYKFM